jgi:hypothetical protein
MPVVAAGKDNALKRRGALVAQIVQSGLVKSSFDLLSAVLVRRIKDVTTRLAQLQKASMNKVFCI